MTKEMTFADYKLLHSTGAQTYMQVIARINIADINHMISYLSEVLLWSGSTQEASMRIDLCLKQYPLFCTNQNCTSAKVTFNTL